MSFSYYERESGMASTIIHYTISNLLLKKLTIKNKELFLLGASLGPDASSHEDGTYDVAHFLSYSEDGTRKGIDWIKFAEKYKNDILTDEFILGYFCHLIQDALWFHDLVDKCIRCYAGEEKKLAYQRGYHDYERLNYLLINEFELAKVNFGEVNILVNEISTDKLVLGKNMFEQWFLSNPCRKEELDIYNWDIINDYINNSVDLCLSEISKLMQEENGLSPEELFVVA